MDLVALVRTHGGVVRTQALRDAGASRHAVQAAVASGRLVHPRRGWIAVPTADPALADAAAIGAVLTCVTQAARDGLWNVGDARTHVGLAPHHRARRETTALLHWAVPPVPRDPRSLVDPVENVLALVAECQPFETALAVWESALRQRRVDVPSLRTLPLRARARKLLDAASPFSDAGTESIIVHRLRWLRLPMLQQAFLLGRRVDLLIGDRLVVQVDGGHHVGVQRMQDNEHDARLRLAGYHVIRVSYWQIMNEWTTVQALITGAIARGLHLA